MARRINSRNLVTAISVIILVGTEILGAALAFGWAMGGLLELGGVLTAVLIGVSVMAGLYGIYSFARRVLAVETPYRTEG